MRHSDAKVTPAPTNKATKQRSTANRKVVHRKRSKKPGFFRSLWQLLSMTFFGRILIGILVAVSILILDSYVVSFRYEPFFMIVGIEMVLIGIIAWIRFMIRTSSTS